MKVSQFKDYSELPLFLNAETVAKVLGVSPSSSYELMHEPGFPVLKVGNRMVVPKEKFIRLFVKKNFLRDGKNQAGKAPWTVRGRFRRRNGNGKDPDGQGFKSGDFFAPYAKKSYSSLDGLDRRNGRSVGDCFQQEDML